MNKKFKSILFATVIVFLSGCDDKKETDAENYVPTVEVIKIETGDIPLKLEYPARAAGFRKTEVRSRVSGILLKRYYTEGENVQKGDILFEIDPAPYQLTLEQVEAELAETEAKLEAAETNWKRISRLFENKIVSEKSRDEAKSELNSLKANKKQAMAKVKSARLDLEYTKVAAPISGITEMAALPEGSLISTNDLLTKITQVNPLYAVFFIAENEILVINDMIHAGRIKDVKQISDLVFKAKYGNDNLYTENGRIDFFNPNVNDETGTIKLRAIFPNNEKRLIPGQFLRIFADNFIVQNTLLIPQTAVMQEEDESYVYIVSPENKIQKRLIKTGMSTENYDWIVEEGLTSGELIVVGSLQLLENDMAVIPEIVNQ